jgi:Icc-related predicted phosphoesterase
MLIYATGDLHYPEYKELFQSSLKKMKDQPDLFLLAGDISAAFHPRQWYNVVKLLKKFKCPIIAVPGNSDFDQHLELIQKICGEKIKLLNDELIDLKISGKTISIIGSRGVLDMPTPWQLAHIADAKMLYEERAKKIKELVKKMRGDFKILLTHYAPVYETVEGEAESIKPQLATNLLYEVIDKKYLDLVVHAHAHCGTAFANISGVPVFNVSLPLNNEIVVIDTEKI